MSTACHQIEVFSRVLRTSITTFLEGGVEVMEKNLPEFTVSLSGFCNNNFPRGRGGVDGKEFPEVTVSQFVQ